MTTVRFPAVKVRTVDGWLDCVAGVEDVDPDDAPPDWQTAFDSRNLATLDAFYASITGYDPEAALLDVGGDFVVTDAWLAAQGSNPRVSFADGLWTVERYQTTQITNNATDDVRFLNCYIASGGNELYGVRRLTGDVHTRTILEQCELAGGMGGSSAINFPNVVDPDTIIIRYCNAHGYASGFKVTGGTTIEYSWMHDLYFFPESHNTGASIRARNVTIRRCNVRDGGSSAISCYAESSPYTGILLQENVLASMNTGNQVNHPSDKPYATPQPGETRRCIGNLIWDGTTGRPENFTEFEGNFDQNGDPVVVP